ncbi:flippase [Paucibacter sp. PLA-PC-4]|uniref:flippase n=1 Tax=Paucibacter sp. PLA-PC-4 TaxID=2993655 RepID=UPI00224A7ED1|nr:flippase [Paucibacter sp. PLA-PC-4]MCX2865127.1 flippase [Paucibacter sp. PLA-PC-4]
MKLARHTLFNLIGLGAPLLLAAGAIPALLAALGSERFGLLTLLWAVTSYFGLFDLGLGRSLTQQLSILFDQGRDDEVGPASATALALMAVLGSIGGCLMLLLAPWGVGMLKISAHPKEAIQAAMVMGLAMPFIVLTAGLRGMLEARHAFFALNCVRLPIGLWTFAGPWLVLVFVGPDLVWIAGALAGGRMIGCAVHGALVWRAVPQLRGRMLLQRQWLRPFLVSGGWLTLSNLISPFMGYADRFLIGATISAAAVALYAIPHELVTKIWIIPAAMTSVLFPAFAATIARQDPDGWRIFDRAVGVLFLCVLPIASGLFLFASELLQAWVGEGFARQSAPILQIFAIGILINCLAHVPLTWLHGAGYYRAPALLYCIELPVFLVMLWCLCTSMGLKGAAVAWLIRICADSAALFYLVYRHRGAATGHAIDLNRVAISLAAVFAALSFAGAVIPSMLIRAAWLILVIAIVLSVWWRLRRPSPVPMLQS